MQYTYNIQHFFSDPFEQLLNYVVLQLNQPTYHTYPRLQKQKAPWSPEKASRFVGLSPWCCHLHTARSKSPLGCSSKYTSNTANQFLLGTNSKIIIHCSSSKKKHNRSIKLVFQKSLDSNDLFEVINLGEFKFLLHLNLKRVKVIYVEIFLKQYKPTQDLTILVIALKCQCV